MFDRMCIHSQSDKISSGIQFIIEIDSRLSYNAEFSILLSDRRSPWRWKCLFRRHLRWWSSNWIRLGKCQPDLTTVSQQLHFPRRSWLMPDSSRILSESVFPMKKGFHKAEITAHHLLHLKTIASDSLCCSLNFNSCSPFIFAKKSHPCPLLETGQSESTIEASHSQSLGSSRTKDNNCNKWRVTDFFHIVTKSSDLIHERSNAVRDSLKIFEFWGIKSKLLNPAVFACLSFPACCSLKSRRDSCRRVPEQLFLFLLCEIQMMILDQIEFTMEVL